MKSFIIVLLVSIAVINSSGCGIISKKYTKSETSSFRLNAAGKTKFILENVTGSVTVSQSSDSGVVLVKAFKEIKVKKKYLNTPFDEITVKVDTAGNVIQIKTEIEKEGQDGIFRFDFERGQRVDYEISLPKNISIEIENVNGNIAAGKIDNDMRIDLVNGDISLESYTGLLECETTNGDFSGHIDSTRGMNISTINGGISLFLNSFMNANLRAETVNGRITEENLQLREVIKEKKLFKGKLGSGTSEVDIKLETVNGKIRLFGKNEI